jgi:uncharacterized membrane protein
VQIPYDSSWVQVFGRFHIVVLHFPIAIIAVAALLILWSLLRRSGDSETRHVCPGLWLVGIAALSAVVAATTGWVFAGAEYADLKGTLNLHRWLGVASAALVAVAYIAGLVALKGSSNRASRLYMALVLIAAPLVGFTGHVGGGLVHGKNFVFQPLLRGTSSGAPSTQPIQSEPLDQMGLEDDQDKTEPALATETDVPLLSGPAVDLERPDRPLDAMSVSFEADVMPILVDSCIRCHNPEKSRGRVRLDDLEHVLQTVEPGEPDKSLIIFAIELPESDEDSMPLDEPSLPDNEIAKIRAWIASLESD